MKLIVHIGGHSDADYRIESEGNEIAYWKFCKGDIDDYPQSIHPSDDQWNRFWSFMQECDGWAERYEDPDILDGTSWLVQVENGELSIWSSGSNDYPENFQTFLKEIRLLIGGRTFE